MPERTAESVARPGTREATVHLVYPHGPRVSAPETIGRHLGEYLSRSYRVVFHDWDEMGAIRPAPGDLLIGHPHPVPLTRFRASTRQPGWRRVVMMCPYHKHPDYMAYVDPVIRRCDGYLAITGKYWFDTLADGPLAHWAPRTRHLDLAVDPVEFPRVKEGFAPPGKRRFVYIGNTAAYKNTNYLSEIARAAPDLDICWIGGGGDPIAGLRQLGVADFSHEEGRRLIAGFDFLLTVGWGDANPTTVLECMAWGIVPVCTPQSGYVGERGIASVPLRDPGAVVSTLRRLQQAPESELQCMQAANWEAIARHYNWDRFGRVVAAELEAQGRAPLLPAPIRRRAHLRWKGLTGTASPAHVVFWKGCLSRLARRKAPRLLDWVRRWRDRIRKRRAHSRTEAS